MLTRLLKRSPTVYAAWRRLRGSSLLPVAGAASVSGRALRRHAQAALDGDPSHAGEARHLGELLRRCGIERGFVVDLGAGDGVFQSCTLFLFRDPAWRGIAVEMDPLRFRRLEAAYRRFPNARPVRHRVTPASVAGLLEGHDVPTEFEVLNLDLDSYDLCVAEALLTRFRPAVVSMEINEKIPPPVYFRVLFDPQHVWAEDHFYGCSIAAAAHHVKPRGYALESLQYNNAFFVRDDVGHGRVRDEDAEEAYDRDYRTRPDRRELFPWNHDVEDWQRSSPVEVVERLHRRFAVYGGKFIAASRPPGSAVASRAAGPPDHRGAGRSGKGDGW